MADEHSSGWRDRLVVEIKRATKESRDKADPRPSMREASNRAGLGPNYISNVAKGKEADVRLDKLIALCEVLEIDLIHILTGVRWDREVQDALAAFSVLKQHDRAAWDNFRSLLAGYQQRVSDEVDSNMEAASQRVRKPGRGS